MQTRISLPGTCRTLEVLIAWLARLPLLVVRTPFWLSNHARFAAGTKSVAGIEPASCVTNTISCHAGMSRRCLSLACTKQMSHHSSDIQQSLTGLYSCPCHLQKFASIALSQWVLAGVGRCGGKSQTWFAFVDFYAYRNSVGGRVVAGMVPSSVTAGAT